jgi:hypothetical protein
MPDQAEPSTEPQRHGEPMPNQADTDSQSNGEPMTDQAEPTTATQTHGEPMTDQADLFTEWPTPNAC